MKGKKEVSGMNEKIILKRARKGKEIEGRERNNKGMTSEQDDENSKKTLRQRGMDG